MSEALMIDNMTVAFGAFKAIDVLTLYIDYGTVRAIIGPNGAGKTTLLDAITGKSPLTKGRIILNGRTDLRQFTEPDIARAGIGRKFQKPSVFEALTLNQNLGLSLRSRRRNVLHEMLHRLDREDLDRIEQILETIGMSDLAGQLAGTLSHGQKQWLEIGMLLIQEPAVLLLDEPVAGMSEEETDRTAELIKSLRAPERAIVVIEHDMSFVERIADRVTVLHDGQLLVEGRMETVKADPRVIEVYLGR